MRILFLTTVALSVNGITEFISQYVEHETEHCIDIVSSIKADPTMEVDLGKYCDNFYRLEYRKDNPVKYMFSLIKIMKKNKYDILHAHGTSATLAIELLAAKIAGIEVRIAHSHNTFCENIRLDKILRPLFNSTYTHALACGKEAGKWLFRDKKFTVIPNGRSVNKFTFNPEYREKIRKKLGVDENIVVGHAGVFYPQKNYFFIVDLFEDLLSSNENYKLVLMGKGPQYEEVKNYVANKNLSEHIIFTGLVSNVEQYLSAMDVMILPSLFEGLPLVAIEWQINGLPTILSDTITDECKVTDLVSYVPITDTKYWKEKIILHGKRTNFEDYKKYAQIMFDKGYDRLHMKDKLNKYYSDCINEE